MAEDSTQEPSDVQTAVNGTTAQHPPALNIDDDAARILRSATLAVKAILERRAQLDMEGKQDTPLVVLAGENHTVPAHHLHHLLVLAELKKTERIAFDCEHHHDMLAQQFQLSTGQKPDAEQGALLTEADRTGALTLKSFLGFLGCRDADHARSTLYRFLLRNRIPTHFSDAAKQGDFLDADDPSTAASLRACFGTADSDVNITSEDGLFVRNHHMAAEAFAHARDSGARILVQQCGNAHLVGKDRSGDPDGESLAAQFKRLGAPVLALPLFGGNESENPLPADLGLQAQEKCFIYNMPKATAIYDLQTNKPIPDDPATLQSRPAEAAYINALLPRIGQPGARLSVKDWLQQSLCDEEEMNRLFKKIQRPATPSLAA